MNLYVEKNYLPYVFLSQRKGDRLNAQENLGKAIKIFKECGADGWAEKAERELATLM